MNKFSRKMFASDGERRRFEALTAGTRESAYKAPSDSPEFRLGWSWKKLAKELIRFALAYDFKKKWGIADRTEFEYGLGLCVLAAFENSGIDADAAESFAAASDEKEES